MRLLLLSFLFVVLFASCKVKGGREDHLPKAKMEQILLDINLAEAYSTMVRDSLHKLGNKNPDSLAKYYKDIFNHHNVTREQFEKSLYWYKAHPDDLDTLVNNILPVVTKMTLTK